MSHHIRSVAVSIAALLTAAVLAPTAAAEFGVANWEAGTCSSAGCKDAGPTSEFFTQAAGHPQYGITDFRFNASKVLLLEKPEGNVKDVRVDLPPGLAVNPEAVERCSEAQLAEWKCPAGSKVGEDIATGSVASIAIKESFPVYDMERRPGEPARFAVEVKSTAISALKLESVIYLDAGLSWYHEPPAPGGESSGVATGDFHEYFKIENIPTPPELIESKLVFWGRPHEHNPAAREEAFITMPSTCSGPQTTWLHVDSWQEPGHFVGVPNETPVGATGCESLAFDPGILQSPETSRSDAPDGSEVAFTVPQATDDPEGLNSPNPATVQVTLPEGMTLNPSAASGLEACTDEEIGIGTDNPVSCPARSVIGALAVDAPGIPAGALNGKVYLGTQQSSDPESGEMYRIFLAAEAPEYGVGVRLEGSVRANARTGRLAATFSNLPQVPFERFALTFKGGEEAPLANPLACGKAVTEASVLPYSAPSSPVSALGSSFAVDANGRGAACSSPLRFEIGQSAVAKPPLAASSTSFTLQLTRAEGQQYLSSLDTALPEGLIGLIPVVPRCGEPEAAAARCPQASQIGTATAAIGSGSKPYAVSGPVYLTGAYGGAPFGLAIPIDASSIGPYDFGTILTRAKIEIDPLTARVSVSASLPTIVGGVPIRLRTLEVTIDHPGFLANPTSCAPLATETALTSTFGAAQTVTTPFQATGCESLPFKPKLTAHTDAKTSRRRGAGLRVTVTEPPHGANLRSVSVKLPRQLVARISTLHEACAEATFEANPYSCPSGARVGGATVFTPALPDPLSGPVYLVSHGSFGYPDIDVLLSGDGVSVNLQGNTLISHGITSSTFGTLPDVPITSFAINLPVGAHSMLGAPGRLCRHELTMPTTIVGQNVAKLTEKIRISVSRCPVEVLSREVKGLHAILRVRTPSAGELALAGKGVRSVHRKVGKAQTMMIVTRLSRRARVALRSHRRLRVRVDVRFVKSGAPKQRSDRHVKLVFRRG